jgi:hypothetical protein
MILVNSSEKSPVDHNGNPLFFSLVDYRNNYFVSSEPNKVIEFYNSFVDREHLIQWMKERPKGAPILREIDGNKDIIVVIPTADFNGKYAKECRENIFKGIHIIFVESSNKWDFYFNFAHYVNTGIKKAIEYNPKWVIYSDLDVLKVDDISIAADLLNSINNDVVGLVYAYPTNSHLSHEQYVAKPRFIREVVHFLLARFGKDTIYGINKKFAVKYSIKANGFLNALFYKSEYRYRDIISFGIFSKKMLDELLSKCGYVFDETFLNCHEESDLAIRISKSGWRVANISYKIRPLISMTLGNSHIRQLRDQASATYFSMKLENH